MRSVAINVSVCLSVRSDIAKTTCPNFTQFSACITRGRGSILFCRQQNTLCTSGFLDDVMFSHNGAYTVARWQRSSAPRLNKIDLPAEGSKRLELDGAAGGGLILGGGAKSVVSYCLVISADCIHFCL